LDIIYLQSKISSADAGTWSRLVEVQYSLLCRNQVGVGAEAG